MVGYTAMESEMMSSLVSTWAPKICTVIIAIAISLTTNIIPHVTTSYIKKEGKPSYFKNNINDIIKNTIPKASVNLLINNSAPLSFIFLNNASFPPVIIFPASDALLLCNNTITIRSIDTTNKIVSNILFFPAFFYCFFKFSFTHF